MNITKYFQTLQKETRVFIKKHIVQELSISSVVIILVGVGIVVYGITSLNILSNKNSMLSKELKKVTFEYADLKNQDQYKINKQLSATMSAMQDTFKQSVSVYEKLVDLKTQIKDTSRYDSLFAESIKYLADENYSSAGADLKTLTGNIQEEEDKLAAAAAASGSTAQQIANAPQSNAPPGSGFSQQKVNVDGKDFLVDIIAADLNSTRVIVDTASSSDCSNNCPVLSLGDYVGRNGAFAGINGTFFCPADYPSCAGKTGSFDTLLMNKDKHYFNSDNNVYSNVPLVFFTGNTMGVRGASSDWGRTTDVDSVIAMQPLLISGGNIAFTDSPDPKFNSVGPRSFIAAKGNTVYIGFTFNATMGESAKVMKALGMDNALNLDEGGSSALWFGGYKVGPGRNIPNAVLFVHK